jgi:hypothetical protein
VLNPAISASIFEQQSGFELALKKVVAATDINTRDEMGLTWLDSDDRIEQISLRWFWVGDTSSASTTLGGDWRVGWSTREQT